MVGYAVTIREFRIVDDHDQCCNNIEPISFSNESWNQSAFMQDQCQEICIHKWIESQKAGQDLGPQAVRDWITKHAKSFREYAVQSGKYAKK